MQLGFVPCALEAHFWNGNAAGKKAGGYRLQGPGPSPLIAPPHEMPSIRSTEQQSLNTSRGAAVFSSFHTETANP